VLAIIMDRLKQGKELEGPDFQGELRIKPSERGKSFEKQ
jgi:predicted SpoU family rRNA methylase